MGANGITVSFSNPEKRKKRMKAYQEYIDQLYTSKRVQQKGAPETADVFTGKQEGCAE